MHRIYKTENGEGEHRKLEEEGGHWYAGVPKVWRGGVRGEHRVFWCEKFPKPLRKGSGELEDRTWRSWTEVDEWARDKQVGPEVAKFFEEARG